MIAEIVMLVLEVIVEAIIWGYASGCKGIQKAMGKTSSKSGINSLE